MRVKNALLIVLAALSWAAPFAAAQAPTDELSVVPRISQADFKKLLATGNVLVVDARDESSYQNGHIPGSICIPLADLDKHVNELKGERRSIVTYCA